MKDNKAHGTSAYEFCSVPMNVRNDGLSNFIYSCGLTVKQFGFQKQSPASCGPRIYGDLELIYILCGEGIVTVDGTTYHGFGGDMFIIPKHSVCSIESLPHEPFQNYWMHVDISDIIAAERLKLLLGGPLLHLQEDAFLMQCWHLIESEYTRGGEGSYLSIHSLLHLILLRIIRTSPDSDSISSSGNGEGNSGQSKLLRECIRLITDHHGAVSVSEMCRALYVSPTYVRRVFQKLLKQSPLEFIHSVRIREAEMMLLTTSEPISVIAAKLGFSSPYHFSNEFRKHHRISPVKYRNTVYEKAK